MSENIIFEQIKLGACVIPLFRGISSGKIHLSYYFCDSRSSSRSSAGAISIQGHENFNYEVKNEKKKDFQQKQITKDVQYVFLISYRLNNLFLLLFC